MLTKVTLENFKCYKGKHEFDLAPITLIYGPNSGGKSTLLQSLKLLRQTYDMADRNTPLLFSCRNGLVELGSFENVVHGHNIRENIGIGLEFDLKPPTSFVYVDGPTSFETRVLNKVESDRLERSSGNSLIEAQKYSLSMLFSMKNKCLALQEASMVIDGLSVDVQSQDNFGGVKFITYAENKKEAYKYFYKNRNNVLKGIEAWHWADAFSQSVARKPLKKGENFEKRLLTAGYKNIYESLESKYAPLKEMFGRKFSIEEYEKLCCGVLRYASGITNRFLPMATMVTRITNARGQLANEMQYLHASGEGLQISEIEGRYSVSSRWDESFGKERDVMSLISPESYGVDYELWTRFFSVEMEHFLAHLFPLNPVRPEAKPVYNVGEIRTSLGDAYDSGFVALMEGDVDAQKRVNEWLERMGVG